MSEPLLLFLLKGTSLQNKCSPILNRRAFCLFYFLCLSHHILNKYPIPRGSVAHENVSDGADELSVLNDWATRQECCQWGTTFLLTFVFGNRRQGNSDPRHSLLRRLTQTKSRLQFHHRWRRGRQTNNPSWLRFRREPRFRAKCNLR